LHEGVVHLPTWSGRTAKIQAEVAEDLGIHPGTLDT
jgi:hypothetical protein